MFLHEFREDFVLALELLFQEGDPPIFGVTGASSSGFEGGGGVLEELLLPAVEHCGMDVVLVTEVRNRDAFEEMKPKDGGLLLGSGAFPSLLGHGKTSARDCSLFERFVFPIPAEAEQRRGGAGRAIAERPDPGTDDPARRRAELARPPGRAGGRAGPPPGPRDCQGGYSRVLPEGRMTAGDGADTRREPAWSGRTAAAGRGRSVKSPTPDRVGISPPRNVEGAGILRPPCRGVIGGRYRRYRSCQTDLAGRSSPGASGGASPIVRVLRGGGRNGNKPLANRMRNRNASAECSWS